MKKLFTISTLSLVFFLSSCGGGNTEQRPTEVPKVDVQPKVEEVQETTGKATYLYQNDSTKVSWMAYKTTEKKGVGGKFTNIDVTNVIASENPMDVVKGAKFSIPVTATVTGNKERDNRIMKFFFGMLSETANITGQMKTVNEDGTGTIAIIFNAIEKELPITYTLEGEKITVKGSMNLALWNAQKGIDALNEECKTLHAGADGITKLWPDVDIEITTVLKKEIQ